MNFIQKLVRKSSIVNAIKSIPEFSLFPTTQRNKDLEAAALATHQLQTQLDKAQNELNIAKQRLATLSANNAVPSKRLRESIAAYNRNLSDDSKQTLILRVTTLSDVLGECTSRYSELASKADAYAADLKMMQEAWPKWI